MNRTWVWIVAAVILVAAATGGLLIANKAKDKTAQQTEIPAPKPSADQEERARLEQMVASGLALPAKSLHLDEAYKTPEGWVIRFSAKAREVKLLTLLEEARKIFQELGRTGVKVADVSLLYRTDVLTNVFGRQMNNEPIASIRLSGQTFSRMVWGGFDPRDFSRVADEFWLHDELQIQEGKLQEEQLKERQEGKPREKQSKSEA